MLIEEAKVSHVRLSEIRPSPENDNLYGAVDLENRDLGGCPRIRLWGPFAGS